MVIGIKDSSKIREGDETCRKEAHILDFNVCSGMYPVAEALYNGRLEGQNKQNKDLNFSPDFLSTIKKINIKFPSSIFFYL